jgi:hypothetical protein
MHLPSTMISMSRTTPTSYDPSPRACAAARARCNARFLPSRLVRFAPDAERLRGTLEPYAILPLQLRDPLHPCRLRSRPRPPAPARTHLQSRDSPTERLDVVIALPRWHRHPAG